MDDEILYIPENSGLSELKKLFLAGGLAGTGISILNLIQDLPKLAEPEHSTAALVILIGLGIAHLGGAAIVFFTLRKFPKRVVDATWFVALSALYVVIFTNVFWRVPSLWPFT